MTIEIEILNPDVKNLLQELANLNLIKIKEIEEPDAQFTQLLNNLRNKGEIDISIEDITTEVDIVRTKRLKGRDKSSDQ